MSYYEKSEERNGTETAVSAETPGAKDEGGEKKSQVMRRRRRRNEANGHTGREEDEDEGLCVMSAANVITKLKVVYNVYITRTITLLREGGVG